MAVPIIVFANDLATKVGAIASRVIDRRYVPEFDKEKVRDGKWFVVVSDEQLETIPRRSDRSDFVVDLCYEIALPDSTEAYQNPLDNTPFLDACMEEVERIKALFRENGAGRDLMFPYTFIKMQNTPLYHQDYLFAGGIFISAIRLTFLFND